MNVEVSERRQTNSEATLLMEQSVLQRQLEEEIRVSQRIEQYLKRHYEDLAGKVDHWMNKHENDSDMKSRDLHELKVNQVLTWV